MSDIFINKVILRGHFLVDDLCRGANGMVVEYNGGPAPERIFGIRNNRASDPLMPIDDGDGVNQLVLNAPNGFDEMRLGINNFQVESCENRIKNIALYLDGILVDEHNSPVSDCCGGTGFNPNRLWKNNWKKHTHIFKSDGKATGISATQAEIYEFWKGIPITDLLPKKYVPINGGLSNWTEWSECEFRFEGDQMRTRTKYCNNPFPEFGGDDCGIIPIEIEPCMIQGLNEWGEWGACETDTDGLFKKRRYQTCLNPKRLCNNLPFQTELCPINGGLSDWTEWGECLMDIDGVLKKTRSRLCNNPTPANEGADCGILPIESEICYTKEPASSEFNLIIILVIIVTIVLAVLGGYYIYKKWYVIEDDFLNKDFKYTT
jgi:hypothetical protein